MSQVAITLGHPEAHEKLTAKLFWKRTRDTGYNDAGNVREFVDATTRSLVVRARAEDGFRAVNDEQVDVDHQSFTFLLDERDPNQELLLKLARQLTGSVQAGGEGSTATITSIVLGKWYAIGSYNIANLAVTASQSGAMVEGTDYDVDKENGRLHVLLGAGVSAGETLTLTFDTPTITFEQYESQYDPLFYCDFIVEEHNQFAQMWLRRAAFKGYLNVTEFPSQTGEFGTYRVKVTPAAAVTWLKRPEGQTLPSHTEQEPIEAAAASSSSVSSSSASQSSTSQTSASS